MKLTKKQQEFLKNAHGGVCQEWKDSFDDEGYIGRHCEVATKAEVRKAMIVEAQKRGFVAGAEFGGLGGRTTQIGSDVTYDFDHFSEDDGWIIYIQGSTIFHNGKWVAIGRPEFVVGKWYHIVGGNVLVRYTGGEGLVSEGVMMGYGFSADGVFTEQESLVWGCDNDWGLAPESVIKAALIREARKRGLIDGATVSSACNVLKVKLGRGIYVLLNDELYYDHKNGGIRPCLLHKNKWAEVVIETKTITFEGSESELENLRLLMEYGSNDLPKEKIG